jgi:glycosyltransferase involved in cell wall biosynthesis
MTPETSYGVEPGDPAALARALEDMLDDEETRQTRGVAARQLAIDHYSWQDIGRRLERIYDSARQLAPAPETVAA